MAKTSWSPIAPLAFVALMACNSVVLPSVGGGDDGCTDCKSPPYTPTYPYPIPPPTPTPASCTFPDRVTASGELVRETTDAGAPFDASVDPDAGDGGDAPPPIDPGPTSLDLEIDFAVSGGSAVQFGAAPSCIGCELRRTAFNAYGGTITLRVTRTEGTVSAFSPVALRVPFGCGATSGFVTLKIFQKPGESRVTVEGYATS